MSQEIIRIETINTDVINVATTEVIKIEGVGLQGNSGDNVGVLSFNGRIGIVFPELDDYQASLVDNDSSVVGDTVKDALDTIQTDLDGLPSTFVTSFDGRTGAITPSLDDYQASLITNNSTETGATVKDALDALDIEQGTQNTDIATNAGDIVTINNEQIVQNDAITAIEDTAVFESPVSPFPINYIWLGNQFQYDLIGLNGNPYEDDTIYNVNNNLKSPLYFYTKDVSPVTPTLTGVTPDSQSAGSNEGVILANGSPSYSYADPSVEHLVEFDNFDPLDVVNIQLDAIGATEVDISSLAVGAGGVVFLYSNTALTGSVTLPTIGASNCSSLRFYTTDINELVNSELYTGLTGQLDGFNANLQGEFKVPIAPNMTIFRLFGNSGLTSITSMAGCLSTNLIDHNGCALTQASVDNIFNDTDSNGVSNGTLNVSGGTNSAPSGASLTARTNLIGRGWTLTFN